VTASSSIPERRRSRGRKEILHEASATLPDRTMTPLTNTGGGSTAELDSLGFDPEVVASNLEEASAEEALRWALHTFSPRMYIACSFQKTSSVTVHLAQSLNPDARFFYLDTDVLFPETYETKDRLEERYGIRFHRYSSITLEQQKGLYGDEL
jgi:3'-phosphoadenosine 5'-phosphosulfate sulfotransferase (PAPS reductase)/FAD synthetase